MTTTRRPRSPPNSPLKKPDSEHPLPTRFAVGKKGNMNATAQPAVMDLEQMIQDWEEADAEAAAENELHAAMRKAHDELFNFAQALREIDEREART